MLSDEVLIYLREQIDRRISNRTPKIMWSKTDREYYKGLDNEIKLLQKLMKERKDRY